MRIVELVTVEANKAMAENRLTAMDYARLVKKLRANEDNAISIIRDCRIELCKRYMATNPNERTAFEDMYCSQLVRMVEFLRDTVKAAEETIIEEPAVVEVVAVEPVEEEVAVVESYVDDEDEEMTIFQASCFTTGQLDTTCKLIGLDNPLEDIWRAPLSVLSNKDLEELETLYELLPIGFAEVEWEENDADDYYYDCYQEALGGLDSLINTLKELQSFRIAYGYPGLD